MAYLILQNLRKKCSGYIYPLITYNQLTIRYETIINSNVNFNIFHLCSRWCDKWQII